MRLNNKNGVTLIELLIAITLSIVIILILFAGMRLGYKSQETGTEKAETTQKIRIIGDRITWLIRGAYPFFIKKPGGQKIYFEGKQDSIGFVTTSVDTYAKGPEDIAGLKWISIYTDDDGLKIRENVFFLEDVFDATAGKVYVFDPEVTKMEFEYFDLPEDKKEGTWVSDWDPDEKKYLPSAVKVKITFLHNRKNIAVPEMIVRISTYKKA